MRKSFRLHMFALFAIFSMVGGACVAQGPTEESEIDDLGEGAQALDEEGGGGDPGVSGGGCAVDCDCPLGEHCYVDHTCRGTVVFGPALPIPPCVDSCQCGGGMVCDMWAGSYGYCK